MKTHSARTHSRLRVDSLRTHHWPKLRRPHNPDNPERASLEKVNLGRENLGKDRPVRAKDSPGKGKGNPA